MESERLMFASIMGGSSIEEAIEIYHASTSDDTDDSKEDDVEMF
jgi:hypothetical protein